MSLPWVRFHQAASDLIGILQDAGRVVSGTSAQRQVVSPTDVPAGTLWVESDRLLVYVAGPTWSYVCGQMQTTLAGQPLHLGASDAGLLLHVSDYGHLLRWSGTVWELAPGDPGNGFFQDFAVAPPDAAWWQACDGSPTTYLHWGVAPLDTLPFTTPSLSGSPAYRKSGAAYSGAVVITDGALTGGAGWTYAAPGTSDPSHITTPVFFRR